MKNRTTNWEKVLSTYFKDELQNFVDGNWGRDKLLEVVDVGDEGRAELSSTFRRLGVQRTRDAARKALARR